MFDIFAAPPPQYQCDYQPRVEMRMTLEEIDQICRRDNSDKTLYGCAAVRNGIGYIVVPLVGPGGSNQRTQNQIREHEIAHLCGWRHDR